MAAGKADVKRVQQIRAAPTTAVQIWCNGKQVGVSLNATQLAYNNKHRQVRTARPLPTTRMILRPLRLVHVVKIWRHRRPAYEPTFLLR